MMKRAKGLRVETVWDRFMEKELTSQLEPSYATCINCQQGPCRNVHHGVCGMDPAGPIGALVGQVANGNIRGIVAVIGCVTPRDTYGYRVVTDDHPDQRC